MSQGQEAEESKIDSGDTTPQEEALQTRTPRKNGASAIKNNSSSSNSSDNEDRETGYWKSKNRRRYEEDEDISLPCRLQKVDTFTRRISDFSDNRRRRMPANVKTYDGTGDPDDHLKIGHNLCGAICSTLP